MQDSISIVISALNEESNLGPTVELIKKIIGPEFAEYQMIIVDDASTDKTPAVADELAKQSKDITVIHHQRRRGLGAVYKEGLKHARMYYYMLITGDNEASELQIKKIIGLRGEADMIIPYTTNTAIRPPLRRLLSKTFVIILNLLFGLKLKYYNGLVLHKRDILNTITIDTDSFVYQAEALVKLIKSGHSYIETPITIQKRGPGASKALSLQNLTQIPKAIIRIYWQVYFKKRSGYETKKSN